MTRINTAVYFAARPIDGTVYGPVIRHPYHPYIRIRRAALDLVRCSVHGMRLGEVPCARHHPSLDSLNGWRMYHAGCSRLSKFLTLRSGEALPRPGMVPKGGIEVGETGSPYRDAA